MKSSLLFVSICVVFASIATAGNPVPDQPTIKTAIKEWWGIEEAIDDVLVDSIFHDGYAVKVIARIVLFEEPREPLTYQFKGSRPGWVISQGPFDEKKKRQVVADMCRDQAKRNIVMSNMRTLRTAVTMYVVESGEYPLGLDRRTAGASQGVLETLPTGTKNPYRSKEPAFIDALGDTLQWFPEYQGKAVYFPLRNLGVSVTGFVIKGSTDKAFLGLTMRSD